MSDSIHPYYVQQPKCMGCFDTQVVEPLSAYSIDAMAHCPSGSEGAAVAGKGDFVLVEVDGPYHYATGSQMPLGSTILKRR